MKAATVIDKHMKLDQRKIEKAKGILKAKTETETIEKALELVITENLDNLKKRGAMERIVARKNRLAPIKGDVAEWIGESRKQRDRTYGG